ncbi:MULTISPECIES: hemolysin family protein [Micromonospora]|uniref:HlyC/CorC family transporter n=1 Tax=Micromonospora solifontis TaxID=2487138 RepID=A0ABX9WE88_9ACTN|nr:MULTISPECIES: hemolysin family protein [Micromonospora]NES14241.1 HlyC/CorC family transporter [Micromonospora sp. PPF5-17B]NES37677.1 HlyC/CorC family transporter [Micromonospora solifontis]NES55810.1 HlyC/CorC family transporter [Micromonospora sp. PPF5-6]RNL98117.1 HlyC/CorC family transporter [Micromonospora solifontis]
MREAGGPGLRRRPSGRARREPGPVARTVARLVVRAADGATRLVTDLLGASPAAGRERISEAELRDLVAANTVLDPDERRIIDEVLVAGARLVREVMVPRTEVVFLSAGLTLAEAERLVRAETHTRYPVVDGTHDDVVGFVHLRDVLLRPERDRWATVGELTREVKRLPGSKRVLAALTEMRREGHHLAVVIDEYGGTAGIVTCEDLVEELVGEIHDEYDDIPPDPAHGGLPAVVDGRLNLADFAERTGVPLPAGPYETVGGYVMAALGRLPVAGDEVPVAPDRRGAGGPDPEDPPGGWLLRVLTLEGRRVSRLAVSAARLPEQRREVSGPVTAAERRPAGPS